MPALCTAVDFADTFALRRQGEELLEQVWNMGVIQSQRILKTKVPSGYSRQRIFRIVLRTSTDPVSGQPMVCLACAYAHEMWC
jgi:hypothetical protein